MNLRAQEGAPLETSLLLEKPSADVLWDAVENVERESGQMAPSDDADSGEY